MTTEPDLIAALSESQRLGMLGSRPIPDVITHSSAFVDALEDVHGHVVDLGSGGGVPGLVVAVARPDLQLTLVDRRTKRTDLLERLVSRLGLRGRVSVVASDVEDLVRSRGGEFDAVTARGFGPPGATVSVGAELIKPGGLVVVSEPPEGDRWAEVDLRSMGLERCPGVRPDVAVFERIAPA